MGRSNMQQKIFKGLKILLIIMAFSFHANDYHDVSWMIILIFWFTFSVESAISSYKEGKKIFLSIDIILAITALTLFIFGLIKYY